MRLLIFIYIIISLTSNPLKANSKKDPSSYNEYLKSLKNEINSKTTLDLNNSLKNIKSFPVYVSKFLDFRIFGVLDV